MRNTPENGPRFHSGDVISLTALAILIVSITEMTTGAISNALAKIPVPEAAKKADSSQNMAVFPKVDSPDPQQD